MLTSSYEVHADFSRLQKNVKFSDDGENVIEGDDIHED